MVKSAVLESKAMRRDTTLYLVSIVVLYVTFRDGVITLTETLVYVLLYAAYIVLLSQWGKWFPVQELVNENITEEFKQEEAIVEQKL